MASPTRLPRLRRRKRLFDLCLTIPGLLLLSPIFLVLGLLVRLFLGTPVIFAQARPGFLGRPFTLFKFRTMTNARDAHGKLLPDEQRLTRFGRFLRSTSLDELPELLNILAGQMSLVGPRPLLMQYLPRYSPQQARRHEVLPGLTGLAQIKGRNTLTWEQKFELDVWYVDHWSLGLDISILAQTVAKVILREGIEPAGQATTEEFLGTPLAGSTQEKD